MVRDIETNTMLVPIEIKDLIMNRLIYHNVGNLFFLIILDFLTEVKTSF